MSYANPKFLALATCRKVNSSNRLVVVLSHPLIYSSGSYVLVGSEVYVFNNLDELSIDCTSHTVQDIPDITQLMLSKVANVIDGKVYLIADESGWWKKVVMMFDTETPLWEPKLVKEDTSVGLSPFWSDSLVMEDTIYMKDCIRRNSFVYVPEEKKWELMNELMSAKEWEGASVIDEVLYYHDRSECAI